MESLLPVIKAERSKIIHSFMNYLGMKNTSEYHKYEYKSLPTIPARISMQLHCKTCMYEISHCTQSTSPLSGFKKLHSLFPFNISRGDIYLALLFYHLFKKRPHDSLFVPVTNEYPLSQDDYLAEL